MMNGSGEKARLQRNPQAPKQSRHPRPRFTRAQPEQTEITSQEETPQNEGPGCCINQQPAPRLLNRFSGRLRRPRPIPPNNSTCKVALDSTKRIITPQCIFFERLSESIRLRGHTTSTS